MNIEDIFAKVMAKYESDLLYDIIESYSEKNESYDIIDINIDAIEVILDFVNSNKDAYEIERDEFYFANKIQNSKTEERKSVCAGLAYFINLYANRDYVIQPNARRFPKKQYRKLQNYLSNAIRNDFIEWLQNVRHLPLASARSYLHQLESLFEHYSLCTDNRLSHLCTKEYIASIKKTTDEYTQGKFKKAGNPNWRTSLRAYTEFLEYTYKRFVTLEFDPNDEQVFTMLLNLAPTVIVKFVYKDNHIVIKDWQTHYIPTPANLRNWIYDSNIFKDILLSDDISKIQFNIDTSNENIIHAMELIKLMENAKSGDCEAQYEYACKLYEDRDYCNALNWFIESANKGKNESQKKLGDMYFYGEGVPQNYQMALEWYERSAAQENVEALTRIGDLWYEREDGKRDYAIALKYYLQAASKGNSFSQYSAGWMYYYGQGTEKDISKAFHWYTKAAHNGDASGQFCLAKMYYYGESTEKNYEKALNWFKEAAEQGHETSQYYLGWMYYYGQGTEINYSEARIWFEKCAERGNKDAQYRLGEIYYYGYGTDISYENAFNLYEKSAKQGNSDAQFSLGWMYQHGLWTPRNYSEAESWYKKSSEQGNKYAQNELGNLYYKAENYEFAKTYYEKSSQQDFSPAQFSLGKMYFRGHGVNQDFLEAKRFWEIAAEQNNVCAIYCLSCMYRDGIGINTDIQKAKELFEKSKDKLSLDEMDELNDLFRIE